MTNALAINTYIRQGVEKDAPMEARFTFQETDVTLLLHADLTLSLHKRKADGTAAKTKVGGGQFWLEESPAEKEPQLRGLITTGKGSMFELAAWYHQDEKQADEYWSAVVRPRLVRSGLMIRPK